MFNWIGLGSSLLITTPWDKFPSSNEFWKFEVYPVHIHPPLWCSNCVIQGLFKVKPAYRMWIRLPSIFKQSLGQDSEFDVNYTAVPVP